MNRTADSSAQPTTPFDEKATPAEPSAGMWILDSESDEVLLSSESCALLGWQEASPCRKRLGDWMARVHPDDRQQVNQALLRCDGGRLSINHRLSEETVAPQPDGAKAQVAQGQSLALGLHLEGLPERDGAGRLLRVAGTMRAWRQQRTATAGAPLAQSALSPDALLSIAGRVARLGGWSVDLPSMDIQWSDEVAAIYRVPKGYAPVMGCGLDFVAPIYRAQARNAFERCRADGTPWDLELQIVTAQGELRWVRSVGQAQQDERGQTVRLWGAIQDITPRKLAEAERLATMQQLHDLSSSLDMALSVAGLGVARLDLATDTAYWNANLCAILGRAHTSEGRPRQEWQEVFHPEDRRAVQAALRRLLKGSAPEVAEFRIVRPDGSVRHLVGQHTLQRDATGRPASTALVAHDVTEQRQAASARQAQVMAEQANRAKSEFLARMSHELRTPLNAILGFAEILEADRTLSLDGTQRKRVERIRSAGSHLLELINDLLDVSRIETGSLRLQLAPVSLLAEVLEALRLANGQAQARQINVELQQTSHDSDLWVQGDSTRLRQVVLNLLTNAIKYNRPRGKVEVSLARHGRSVVLRVADTGLGMNEQQLNHLFQPFNRLRKEQSTIEGAGIGLVITKHLVELMGGEITVTSKPRQGTEFTARFKGEKGLAAAPQQPFAPALPSRNQPGPSTGRVLYIEDNLVNRALIDGYVSLRPGIELEMAEDGESGIAAAQRQTPDLILIDMMLPDLHGLEVIERLRSIPALKSVRCIAVSANAMQQQIDAAMAAGFNGYLTKPVPLQQLLSELDKLA